MKTEKYRLLRSELQNLKSEIRNVRSRGGDVSDVLNLVDQVLRSINHLCHVEHPQPVACTKQTKEYPYVARPGDKVVY